MSFKKDINLINALLPLVSADGEVEKDIRLFFCYCIAALLSVGATHIAVYSVSEAPPEETWLGLSLIFGIPLSYTMRNRFYRAQDRLKQRTQAWFLTRVIICTLATLAGILGMMMLSDGGTISVLKAAMALLLFAYGITLWNVQLLIAMLNWRMFDKGGIIASGLSIGMFTILYILNR